MSLAARTHRWRSHTPLNGAGVVVEVGVAAARRAPEHELLIVRIILGEEGIER
jgi:hypothetical protein